VAEGNKTRLATYGCLLETLARHESEGTWEFTLDGKQAELALRTMARENRFNRRVLAGQMDEILRTTPQEKSRSRLVQSSSGIVYVFLLSGKGIVAKNEGLNLQVDVLLHGTWFPGSKTVVGIATETYNPADPGFSFDVCYFHSEDWTPERACEGTGDPRKIWMVSSGKTKTRPLRRIPRDRRGGENLNSLETNYR